MYNVIGLSRKLLFKSRPIMETIRQAPATTTVAGAVKAGCQHGADVNINTGTRYNEYGEYVAARYSE